MSVTLASFIIFIFLKAYKSTRDLMFHRNNTILKTGYAIMFAVKKRSFLSAAFKNRKIINMFIQIHTHIYTDICVHM